MAYSIPMIGFLIKKTFFDLWDNMFRIVLVNLGFIASVAIPVFIPPLLQAVPLLSFFVLLAGVLWCFVYLVTASVSLKVISDYDSFGFREFLQNLKTLWPAGLILGALVFVMGVLIMVVIPFYIEMASIFGLFLAAVIFWTLVIGILALQFYPAVRGRLDQKPLKVIKKCFVLFFDNPGLCIFSLIHNIVLLVLSVLLAFLIPGPAGILLYLDEALRLRLLKYEWLEANPGENRRKIPWDALLIDDRERTGTRSLRSFIFPWKD